MWENLLKIQGSLELEVSILWGNNSIWILGLLFTLTLLRQIFLVLMIDILASSCKGWAHVSLGLLKPCSASAVPYISGVDELMPEWCVFSTECLWLPLSVKARRSLEGTNCGDKGIQYVWGRLRYKMFSGIGVACGIHRRGRRHLSYIAQSGNTSLSRYYSRENSI